MIGEKETVHIHFLTWTFSVFNVHVIAIADCAPKKKVITVSMKTIHINSTFSHKI